MLSEEQVRPAVEGPPIAGGAEPPAIADPELESLATERLEAEITTLAAHIAAATCRWLRLVSEFDRREAWASWGCKSCSHWLSWQCAISLRAAREHVRVAGALTALPAITDEFANGRLSYSQARALTRVADPENERELLAMARHATAAQLDKLVRGYLKATEVRDQARDAYDSRELTWWHEDDGSLVIYARMPADAGALVLEAIETVVDKQCEDDRTSTEDCSAEPTPRRARRADALVELARPDRDSDLLSGDFHVVVDVDLDTLIADAPGVCRLACGTVLAPETARRLACDQPVIARHGDADDSVRAGRRTRFASRRLNRLLDRRDGGCRFPGCTHRRYMHTHHIVHWAHGGATEASNLVRLCSHHHRLVHEGGYTITGDPSGDLTFRRPDGRELHGPRCHVGSTDTLRQLNRRHGVQPAATTITPNWHGDYLDLDWVVGVSAATRRRG
jgi:hypothetical protein